MKELDDVLKVNKELCDEIELFRKNFEMFKDRYTAAVKALSKNVDKITKEDLRHVIEKHDITTTETDDKYNFVCDVCEVRWWSTKNDPDESYLRLVKRFANANYLPSPRLYAGKAGWINAYRINNMFLKLYYHHIISNTPPNKKKFREMYDACEI